MCGTLCQVLPVLTALLASGLPHVSGIQIITSGEVEAVNGTEVWLKCTFQTTSPINPSSVTVSWSFRPQGQSGDESVLYYHTKPYPANQGRFHDRVEWAGDIMGKDASIKIRDVKFSYNGTFICQVKNPPDVHGLAGEVRLKVVATASYSEITILAAAVGGGILVILTICIIVLVVKHFRRKRRDTDQECATIEKDLTVCHPAEVFPLCEVEEKEPFDDSGSTTLQDGIRDPASEEEEERCLNDDAEEPPSDSVTMVDKDRLDEDRFGDDRLADGASKAEADHLADGASKADADRLADGASKAEADRLADGASKAEADRLADGASKAEADRLADDASKAEADRLADDASKAEADRLADDASKAEADHLADGASKAEADHLADGASKAEADRLADDASKAEADCLDDSTANGEEESSFNGAENVEENLLEHTEANVTEMHSDNGPAPM